MSKRDIFEQYLNSQNCISQPSEMYKPGHKVDGNNKRSKLNLISKPDHHVIFFYECVFLKAEMDLLCCKINSAGENEFSSIST